MCTFAALRRTLSLFLTLVLLSNQALALTAVGFIGVWEGEQQRLSFWWQTSGWAKTLTALPLRLTGQAGGSRPETQADRNACVVRIEVSPDKAELQTGETIFFSASAYGTAQDTISGVPFTWTVYYETAKRELKLPADGKFTPVSAGKYRIIAAALGHKGETTLTVTGEDARNRDNRPIGEPKIVSTRDETPLVKDEGRTSQWRATDEQQTASLLDSQRANLSKSVLGRGKRSRASGKALAAARAINYPTSCGDQNGWNDCNYSSADDCGRERGDMPGRAPDAEVGSGNFQFSAPVVGLKGRGIDVNLSLVYNSRVWHKPSDASLEITYDIDKDWPAPGWTLGFGKLISMGPNAGVMMVEADGTRHGFRASITNYGGNQKGVNAKTSDGTFIDYTATCDANANGMIPRSGTAWLANGTVITYGAPGNKAVYPTKILDPNGNHITITYVNNSGPKIDTVTDTLNRQIKFWYDTSGCLTTITGPGFDTGTTRELVRLHYRSIYVNAAFASGMSPHVATPNSLAIDAVYYPSTATGYWFGDGNAYPYDTYGAYSTFGMLFKISERRNMGFTPPSPLIPDRYLGMGSVTAGTMTREMVYSGTEYPLTPTYTLTDVPKYNKMRETWDGITPGAPNLIQDSVTMQWCAETNYSVNYNYSDAEVGATVERIAVTRPDGTTSAQSSYKTPGDFKDGLIYKDETLSGTTVLSKSKVTWEYDTTACPNSSYFDYCAPRAQRTEVTDDRGQLTATNYSYSTDSTLRRYNPLIQTDEFDYGGTTLIRRNKTEYNTNANYLTRHIFKLPSATEVYAANGTTRLARTEFYYDQFTGTSGLANTPDVIAHDLSYDPFAGQTTCYDSPGDPDCYGGCPNGNQDPGCDGTCSQICPYQPLTEWRGNVTTIKRFADPNAPDANVDVVENRYYDICGNVVQAKPSCCEWVFTEYYDAANDPMNKSYAYPLKQIRGAQTSAGPQNTTCATYNFNWGLVLTTKDANGRTTTTAYNTTTLRPDTETAPTNAVTQFLYDDVLMKVTGTAYIGAVGSAIAAKSEKYLDGLGRVVNEMALGAGTDQDAVVTNYDGLGRVWRQSRPHRLPLPPMTDPPFYVYQYDSLGRTTCVTSPDGSTAKAFYNQKYPLATSNAPYPSTTGTAAGVPPLNGQTILTVDQWNRERWSRSDSLGRLIEVAEPNPNAVPTTNPGDQILTNAYYTQYAYNALDQLTNVYQGVASGQPTGVQQRTFKYDALNRLTHQKLAERDDTLSITGTFVATYNSTTKHWEGGSWSDYFKYDARSNLVSRTDARGVKTDFSYNSDALNRLQGITYNTTGVPASLQSSIIAATNVGYSYMSSGDLTRVQQMTDGMGTEAYTYDSEGRPSQRTRTYPGRSPLTLGMTYDGADRVQTITYPAKYGMGGNPTPLLTPGYDNASRLTSLTVDSASYASAAIYNAASQTTSLNVGGSTNQLSETYTYDSLNGLLTGQTVQRVNVGTMLNLSYDYLRPNTSTGKTGQLTKITNNLVTNGDKNRIYEYDGIGRLKVAKGGATGTLWTQTYTYDRLGNRTSVAATGVAAGTGGAMPADGLPTTANYEAASNRLTSIVPNASTGINPANPNFDYDPAGNQTRVIQSNGTAQRHYYDAAGRLAQVKADDNTTMIASYGYGASNQRLKQTEYVGGVPTTICYAWAGDSIIGEYLDNGSALVWQKCYVYLGGRLLATQTTSTNADSVQYHHPDRLGTRIISNGGTGTGSLNYSENAVLPYGTAIDAESAGTTTNRRFTSYDRSSVTKLDYAVNRFYDCKQGRFTQVDPIGMSAASLSDPQSLNMYAYVGNDPINRIDPSGLFWKKFFNIFKIVLRVVAIVAAVAVILAASWGISAIVVFGKEFALWKVALMAAGALAASFGAGKLGALLGGIAGASLGSVNFRTPNINGNAGVGAVSNFIQQAKSTPTPKPTPLTQAEIYERLARFFYQTAIQGNELSGIDEKVVLCQAFMESGLGQMLPKALSQYKGPMFVGKSQAKSVGFTDEEISNMNNITNLALGVRAGTRFLASLQARLGSLNDALRAYRFGEAGISGDPNKGSTYAGKIQRCAGLVGNGDIAGGLSSIFTPLGK